MIEFELFYKETIKGTCNLKSKKIKGSYFKIDMKLNYLLIDNIIIEKITNLHSFDIMIKGYKNSIEL